MANNATLEDFLTVAETVSSSESVGSALKEHKYGYDWNGRLVPIDSEKGALCRSRFCLIFYEPFFIGWEAALAYARQNQDCLTITYKRPWIPDRRLLALLVFGSIFVASFVALCVISERVSPYGCFWPAVQALICSISG